MSFRARLSLFFVLIVVVPMASLTFVLFRLIADSEQGKADAGLVARQETALRLSVQARAAAERGVLAVGADARFTAALQRGRTRAAERRAQELLRPLGLERVVVAAGRGPATVDAGAPTAVFPAARRLRGARGRQLGTLRVSTQDAAAYVGAVRRVTGLEVVVRSGTRVLAASSPAAAAAPLVEGRRSVALGGRRFRAASSRAPGFTAAGVRVGVFAPLAATARATARAQRMALAILLGFFGLAVGCAVLVSRGLQRQVAQVLHAARRLGSGDLTARAPTTGRDEFAALGAEFNTMAAELERRLAELGVERERLAGAMRRTGETVAANLDRDGLLEIVVRTAVDGAGAAGGRAGLGGGDGAPLRTVAEAGQVTGLEEALRAAEERALTTDTTAEAGGGGASAMAHALRGVRGAAPVLGVVSVAREGAPFGEQERELFASLARQAAVSVENVGLHEVVERQAVTDDLTGLANRRRFQECLATEVERSRRFGAPLGLVLLDVDDFKAVNDAHGHLVGDRVLREIGRIVAQSAREVDTAARYGGEELAVLLPGTGLDGAAGFAERVRRRIAALELVLPEGDVLRLTASLGAAALPGSAVDAHGLVQAADDALYEAKRSGKDRTVRALPVALG